VDPEAELVIGRRNQAVKLDMEALFPGQRLPGLKPGELPELLGLHRDGKDRYYVEYKLDPALKDFENISLMEDIISYFVREVRPYVADSWIDRTIQDE